jgi:hypothetical protein
MPTRTFCSRAVASRWRRSRRPTTSSSSAFAAAAARCCPASAAACSVRASAARACSVAACSCCGEQGARSAQKTQAGPCIPVRTQRYKAGVGPTSGPTWRLSHLLALAELHRALGRPAYKHTRARCHSSLPFCPYRDSPYKRERGREYDRRPSSKPAVLLLELGGQPVAARDQLRPVLLPPLQLSVRALHPRGKGGRAAAPPGTRQRHAHRRGVAIGR